MTFLKNYSKALGYTVGSMLILMFIITTLNYFNILNMTFLNIFKIIALVISLLIGGFVLGKNSFNKGWLEGLKLSLIFIVILFMLSYLGFDKSFKITDLIFYLITVASSVFGSMIGISKKQEK